MLIHVIVQIVVKTAEGKVTKTISVYQGPNIGLLNTQY